MINQMFCAVKDALDANGFQIPTEIVLDPDALTNQKSLRSLKLLKYIFEREWS